MTRLLSSRDTVQKNSPTANLGSMPCGCCATLPHRDGQGLGSPLHQRAALGGLVPPGRDRGGPRSPQDGARSASLADPSPAGAVARSGGPGPVSYSPRCHAVGQGDLWGAVPAYGDVLPPEAAEGEKESPQAPGHQYLSGGAGGLEKGGLVAALIEAGVRLGQGVWWSDEMGLGLLGQVRGVWGIRGVKIRQKVELKDEWRYLSLAVEVRQGRL